MALDFVLLREGKGEEVPCERDYAIECGCGDPVACEVEEAVGCAGGV